MTLGSSSIGSSPLTPGARITSPTRSILSRLIPAYAGSTPDTTATLPWPARAHPRLRGEHFFGFGAANCGSGSSPLTRGARVVFGCPSPHARLIPAYAGSTGVRVWRWPCLRAHPRLRGEHALRWRHCLPPVGSSPLTRGAHLYCAAPPWRAGLIPAYAGSTKPIPGKNLRHGAHPRLRGEHKWSEFTTGFGQGSSPLTRGARVTGPRNYKFVGLIPAYAGSTLGGLMTCSQLGAHPRLRGEHLALGAAKLPPDGSSPLTRGARQRLVGTRWRAGLIPAYAGSTIGAMMLGCICRAHPRLRGEHEIVKYPSTSPAGSSPLTRGALRLVRLMARVTGLIPAYAGSTGGISATPAQHGAHPRLRGEHSCCASTLSRASGSSPLTRGAQASP